MKDKFVKIICSNCKREDCWYGDNPCRHYSDGKTQYPYPGIEIKEKITTTRASKLQINFWR